MPIFEKYGKKGVREKSWECHNQILIVVWCLYNQDYNYKAKRTVSFPRLAKRLSKIKISPGHTMSNCDSKPQQKHRLGTVSKNFTGRGGGGGGEAAPACMSYHNRIFD